MDKVKIFTNSPWIKGVKGNRTQNKQGSAPYFRKQFKIEGTVIGASIFITALGLFRCYINGRDISDNVLAPSWTDYNKRVEYYVADISSLLQTGTNTLGVLLGNGWACGTVGINKPGKLYGVRVPHCKYSVFIKTAENSYVICSDGTEQIYSDGKIVYNDLYHGEIQDGRKLSVEEAEKRPALWTKCFLGKVKRDIAHDLAVEPPIQITEVLKPKFLKKIDAKTTIINFGQNMVGVISAKIKAKEGCKVRFRYGEMLNKDGSLYVLNLRSAKATDYYICGNKQYETFRPYFTIHGFQYVEFFCEDTEVELLEISAEVIGNNLVRTGIFRCGNKLVNQIYSNIIWGQRGNFLGIPTDCPQRDERLGWTGDAQVFCKTACYNYDSYLFFKKYLRDMRDSVCKHGKVHDVAPGIPKFSSGTPGWADACAIIPYILYQMYGDKNILRENYVMIENWINYCIKHSHGYIRGHKKDYGDWLNVDDDANKKIVGTAFFYKSVCIYAEILKILGDELKANRFIDLSKKIKSVFFKNFIRNDTLQSNSQGDLILTVAVGLVENKCKERLIRALVENIKAKGNHFSCGFMSIGYLMPLLSDNGYHDLAVSLLLNETYPGWGYSIKNGATTIWERWNSYTKESGFYKNNMNSFNHYSFGSVGEWIYAYIAGIRPLKEGFKEWLFKPFIDERVNDIQCKYLSAFGEIIVKYTFQNNIFSCKLIVPDNTKVHVDLSQILENHQEKILGPGTYCFVRQTSEKKVFYREVDL